MSMAIEEAKKSLVTNDVPVGCVIVQNNIPIAYGHNTKEKNQNALGHAEMMAISSACENLSNWRLSACYIYITLEPCPMCMGAILNSRINTIIFGASDFNFGCCGSCINLNNMNAFKSIEIIGGIKEYECSQLMISCFKNTRNNKK